MKFLITLTLSIFCFVAAFNVTQNWATVVCFVAAAAFWICSGVMAEKALWMLEDHEVRLTKLEKRVEKLEGKDKK